MLLPNGIGAAQMLQKGPSLLQYADKPREEETPRKKQEPMPATGHQWKFLR